MESHLILVVSRASPTSLPAQEVASENHTSNSWLWKVYYLFNPCWGQISVTTCDSLYSHLLTDRPWLWRMSTEGEFCMMELAIINLNANARTNHPNDFGGRYGIAKNIPPPHTCQLFPFMIFYKILCSVGDPCIIRKWNYLWQVTYIADSNTGQKRKALTV